MQGQPKAIEVGPDWRPIPSLTGYYSTPSGDVYFLYGRGRPIRPGFLHFSVRLSSRSEKAHVRRDTLVCEAFHGRAPAGSPAFPEHLNGDLADCEASNLKWPVGWLPILDFPDYWLRPDDQVVYCGRSARSGGRPIRQVQWHGSHLFVAMIATDKKLAMRRVIDIVAACRDGSPMLSQGVRRVERAERDLYKPKHHRAFSDLKTFPERSDTEIDSVEVEEAFAHTRGLLEARAANFSPNEAAVLSVLVDLWWSEWSVGGPGFVDRLKKRIQAANSDLARAAKNPLSYHKSLDAPVGDEYDRLLGDTIEDPTPTADYSAGLREIFATAGTPELVQAVEDLACGRLSEDDFKRVPGSGEWLQAVRSAREKYGL